MPTNETIRQSRQTRLGKRGAVGLPGGCRWSSRSRRVVGATTRHDGNRRPSKWAGARVTGCGRIRPDRKRSEFDALRSSAFPGSSRSAAPTTNPISPLAKLRQPVMRCLGAPHVDLDFLPLRAIAARRQSCDPVPISGSIYCTLPRIDAGLPGNGTTVPVFTTVSPSTRSTEMFRST